MCLLSTVGMLCQLNYYKYKIHQQQRQWLLYEDKNLVALNI